MKTFLKTLAAIVLIAALVAIAVSAERHKRQLYAQEVANELERREQAKGK